MRVLQTIELKKYFGTEPNIVRALDGVSLSVEQGEFVAVVGASGSGKTTLLNLIGGLDVPTQGSVLINGTDLKQLDSESRIIFRRSHIGFVFQSYNLVPMLNVCDNIVLPVELDGKEIDQSLFDDIVDTLGLRNKLTELPGNLSGGQQQRVAIARALASDAPVILADEPTGNLDEDTAEEITAILKESAHTFGKCVVVVTHSGEVAKQADMVLEIRRGHLKERNM